MSDTPITGDNLMARGWKQGKALGMALQAANRDPNARDSVLQDLDKLLAQPESFLGHGILKDVAAELLRSTTAQVPLWVPPEDTLHPEPLPYRVWGADQIEQGARAQMDAAMRLPVSVAGALLPDAHQGYGLPIGGVLATEGCVIPFAVGVDIACRMRISVFPLDPNSSDIFGERHRNALLENTHFGPGASSPKDVTHPVLDDPAWRETKLLRNLHGTAVNQIGTSGGGNHFVEWGVLTVSAYDATLDLPPGRYLALLSHSGSRAVGFKIANTYSKWALSLHPKLHAEVKHLAWLALDHEAGVEYWHAMELAGRFASANHEVIHRRVAKAAGLEELAHIENHHNFAWRQTVNGQHTVVHRKGATPAGQGVLGIIPGSMADPGFIVRGKGNAASLDSASHGAGRLMSRTQAKKTITQVEWREYLAERGIDLLGGDLDESPQAYKRIEEVVAAQSDLVDTIGQFTPKMVRMAGVASET